jgi:hypothetical protein
MNDIFMIKTPLKKSQKSPKTLIVFATLMIISIFLVMCLLFPKFDYYYLKLAVILSFCMSMLFGTFAWLLDPGYL